MLLEINAIYANENLIILVAGATFILNIGIGR